MFCVFCGNNIAEGLAACPQCKAPLPARKPSKPSTPAPPLESRPQVATPAPAQAPAIGSQSAMTFTGRVIAGRYRIIGQLGAGAMGAVYKAEEIQTRQLAAIKVLSP